MDDVQLHSQVHQLPVLGDALAVHDVELGLPEGGRDLVLDDLGAGAVADDLAAVLDGLDAADLHADGGVELQGAAAGGDLGVSVDHADLFPELVDEDDHAVGLRDRPGQLPQGLAHQAGQQAHVGVAHVALDLGAGDQGGHGVHDDHVQGAGADQGFTDL